MQKKNIQRKSPPSDKLDNAQGAFTQNIGLFYFMLKIHSIKC